MLQPGSFGLPIRHPSRQRNHVLRRMLSGFGRGVPERLPPDRLTNEAMCGTHGTHTDCLVQLRRTRPENSSLCLTGIYLLWLPLC